MRSQLGFIIWALSLAGFGSAENIYVSVTGNDNNAGTEAAPFQTLAKAQQAVRSQLSGTLTADINVYIGAGVYTITSPLRLTAADSGKNGFKVNWIGKDATISGGIKVTGWASGSNGIWSASVPAGTQSRNLYVGGQAAQYARRKINNRKDIQYTSSGMKWTNSAYDWITQTAGIADAEVRFINSFTDRYAPIRSAGNRELVMEQPTWANQIIGWDHVANPFADFGVFVQNALALLTDAGQFYLDSKAGKVYYKPLNGQNMATIDTYLGSQLYLLSVGGTYDAPARDITFDGITFAHTTWNQVSAIGYIDQQTGGYMGENTTYPEFEASRPKWYQMPSAVQISAATKITMTNCKYVTLGAGGVGIGNDKSAHASGVGLGATDVQILDGYFTNVQGNGITVGGILADAHHPSDNRMIVARIKLAGNIFYDNSQLFSSCVPILQTYTQDSIISHNDIYKTPYSGICHGYGWGSNDAGGSAEYVNRGLYKYQPKYTTPTTIKNNVIEGNLIHTFGTSHTDLGAIYTLSYSPGVLITKNYVWGPGYFGMYTDEGSSGITITGNVFLADGYTWWGNNIGAGNVHTEKNTLIDNYGKSGSGSDNQPNGSGPQGNTLIRNKIVSSVSQTSIDAQMAAYRAGVLPGRRAGRPVSNQNDLADGGLSLGSQGGNLIVNLTNFDDVAFTGVTFTVSGASLTPVNVPTTVPGAGFAVASYKVSGNSNPNIQASAKYTNPRTGQTSTRSASGSVRI